LQRAAEKALQNKTAGQKAGLTKTATPKPADTKLSYKEQKELESLPAQIEQLEADQARIQAELADAGIYRNNPELVKSHQQRLVEIETELMLALERWEVLENKK
jgi:ATP-binding cassette subfamily F protein uup